ncbi:GNAT family N-acetyltransferase [Bdellovibrionota bacterium]
MFRIEGKSTFLRDFQLKDLDIYKHWMNSGSKWRDLDGPYYLKPSESEINVSIEELKQKINSKSFAKPRTRLVISMKEKDELIGTVNSYWESKETNWLCIGIGIYDPAFWGKGIGFAALTLWINYLFESHPDIVRLDFRTWSGNKGMIRLAEKLGFKEEARFRKARIVNKRYYDGLGFGILKEEWKF